MAGVQPLSLDDSTDYMIDATFDKRITNMFGWSEAEILSALSLHPSFDQHLPAMSTNYGGYQTDSRLASSPALFELFA